MSSPATIVPRSPGVSRQPGIMPAQPVPRPGSGLAGYFLMAFAVSSTGVLLVAAQFGLAPPAGAPLEAVGLVFLSMLAGPSLAAVVTTARRQGWAGLRGLASQLTRWHVAPRWYAMVGLAPALLGSLLVGLSLGWPAFTPGVTVSDAPGQLAVTALVVGLAAGFFEELGWTGFATPRLLARHGVLAAGLLLGVPWALWHALADYWGSRNSFGGLWELHMLEWLVALPAFRVLMTWVYARTGSLPLAMLMHAGFTGSQLLLSPLGASPLVTITWYGYFAVMSWLVVMLFAPFDRRRAV